MQEGPKNKISDISGKAHNPFHNVTRVLIRPNTILLGCDKNDLNVPISLLPEAIDEMYIERLQEVFESIGLYYKGNPPTSEFRKREFIVSEKKKRLEIEDLLLNIQKRYLCEGKATYVDLDWSLERHPSIRFPSRTSTTYFDFPEEEKKGLQSNSDTEKIKNWLKKKSAIVIPYDMEAITITRQRG